MTDVKDVFGELTDVSQKAQDIDRAKREIAGPIPLIPEAGDTKHTLYRGLYLNGEFKRDVQLRELTGMDEELLAKQKEPQDFFDVVIALGVKSVDDVDLEEKPLAERRAILRGLLVGERDQLFLAVTKATFGNVREMGFRCTACGATQEITLYLDEDFKPVEVEDQSPGPFTYTTSKGDVLTYRLVTGEDQREALAPKGSTNAEQNTTILSLVISKVNGGLIVDPLAFVRGLSMRDRSTLLTSLISRQPTVALEVTTNCATCGTEQVVRFGWGDIFRG